ncbi:hypothetical protein KY309_00465 [Candidatus Woesearchaeota archaeon]|nr:hypothetical protein [Candidatus Woesearchaeota archaeon]MBW3016066.1 hypothetical protein [Candidatus Woesearchaeota archaeon]
MRIELITPITHIKKKPRKRHGPLMRQIEHIKYALSYYLDKAIPKGAVICALYPKKLLQNILPEVALNKHCKVICIGAPELSKELMQKGLLEDNAEPDIYLTEPDGICPEGAIVKPQETELLKQYKTYAVSSTMQFTEKTPQTHDCVEVYKTITEKGIMTTEQLTSSLSLTP